MKPQELAEQLQHYSAKDIDAIIHRRQAEDRALKVLYRAALAREREERRQAREAGGAD